MNDRRQTMECDTVRGRFFAWLDEDLDPAEVECIKAHLQGCLSCAREWEAYSRTVNLLKELQSIDVPDRVLVGIQARIHRPSRWRRIRTWVLPTPWRFPMPALATLALFVIVVSVVRWLPWSTPIDPETLSVPVASERSSTTALDLEPTVMVSSPELPYLWPRLEGFLAPVRDLEEELEGGPSNNAMLRDDLILDLSGSDDVFNRIKSILREVHGKMFMVGVRNRNTGLVVRSRMVIQVSIEHYNDVLEQIESLGDAYHLFVDRGEAPLEPDRLRIRIVAVSSFTEGDQDRARMVSGDK
jgi:hypothetical protein